MAGSVENYEMVGLGALLGIGATLVGYAIKLIVPEKHFPWTAGLLASNAVIAGFAYVGIKVAGPMLIGWLVFSSMLLPASFIADTNLRDE